jgi:tetratricopeptide (TPR) repeat protein
MWSAERCKGFGARGLLLVALLLIANSASAREDAPLPRPEAAVPGTEGDQVVLRNEEGARRYAAQDYAGALSRFQAAFALEQDPNLFFNIASCHRGLGDLRAAIENYRAFLESPGANPNGREPARQAIIELEAELAAQVAAKRSAQSVASAPRPPAAKDDESWLDHPLVPWLVIGGGAAALLGGASLYALGDADHEQLSETPGLGDPEAVTGLTRAQAQDLLDSGNDKKLAGGAAMALGGALLSGYGAVLLIRELGTQPTSENRLAIVPGRRGGTLSFAGRF